MGFLAGSAMCEFEPCKGQARFDKIMCNSHMCTMCVLEYCTEKCQEWQLEFPGCRCENWAEDRKSFSTGNFAGKGTFGMPATLAGEWLQVFARKRCCLLDL